MPKMMLITLFLLSAALLAQAANKFPSLHSLRRTQSAAKATTGMFSTTDGWGSMTFGNGISQEQALTIMGYITSGVKKYQDDIFNNAIFIQDAIEKDQSFNGKWTIEILNQQSIANWEIAAEVQGEKWLIIMSFAEAYNWTYRIWTAAC